MHKKNNSIIFVFLPVNSSITLMVTLLNQNHNNLEQIFLRSTHIPSVFRRCKIASKVDFSITSLSSTKIEIFNKNINI